MKKIILLITALVLTGSAAFSQVKIGENTVPRQGAVLDLNSPYKGGLLLPNVDITDLERIPSTFSDESVRNADIATELAGMVVWNTHSGSKGVYMWDGNDWKRVSEGKDCYGRVPETPGAMSLSSTTVVQNATFTATVPRVDDVTYAWTLPEGLTGSSNTNEITITADKIDTYAIGTINVAAENECGTGDTRNSAEPVTVIRPCEGAIIKNGAYDSPSGYFTEYTGGFNYNWPGKDRFTAKNRDLCWAPSYAVTDGQFLYHQAVAQCPDTWRCPNLREVWELYVALGGSGGPAMDWDALILPNSVVGTMVPMVNHLTTSTRSDPGRAYDIYFGNGLMWAFPMERYNHTVRCVRDL